VEEWAIRETETLHIPVQKPNCSESYVHDTAELCPGLLCYFSWLISQQLSEVKMATHIP
jgi:hypothetical protein